MNPKVNVFIRRFSWLWILLSRVSGGLEYQIHSRSPRANLAAAPWPADWHLEFEADQTSPQADILLAGACQSDNPGHQPAMAQAYLSIAEQKWQAEDVEQAVRYTRRAMQIDPQKQPQNLLLLEAAQRS